MFVVGYFASFHVAIEKLIGKFSIAGKRREMFAQVLQIVWTADQSGRASTRFAVDFPQQPHVVVERKLALRLLAQGEIERQGDSRAIGVIRNECSAAVA